MVIQMFYEISAFTLVFLFSSATFLTAWADWLRVLHELGGLFATAERDWSHATVPPEKLASIILHLIQRHITGRTAKLLLSTVFHGDRRLVKQIIEDENMTLRPMSREEYLSFAQELLDENLDMANAIKEKRQHGKVMWFVGQMVRRGGEGRVEAEKAEQILRELLGVTR